MSLTVVEEIPESDKAAVWDDLQRYIAELAPFDRSVPKHGPYDYPMFDALWHEAGRTPFRAVIDGNMAGFAFVHAARGGTDMTDFYVRPQYRRSGIGLEFARAVIARFPGPWTLSQFKAKADSIAFWRRVIGDRAFTERDYVSANGNLRVEQRFVS